jgi:hypothetical protein
MSREVIEAGIFTWARIQRLYDADPVAHWQRCESEGLQCPQGVFTQFFHEQTNNADFAVIVRSIDWGRVRWELQEISGMALRQVRVDREYQHALDEARDQATRFGVVDEPQEVIDHWRDAKSWIIPPRWRLPATYSTAGRAGISDRLHPARESASPPGSRRGPGDSEAFGMGRTR